jgi:hypothetical protein
MMNRCLLLLAALMTVACTSLPRTWGKVTLESHNVSVYELLGRPDYFDGQPVRVVGVAGFDFGYEGVSAIYGSVADLRHRTHTHIGLDGFAPDLRGAEQDLEQLNGRFILVEGTFRSLERRRNPNAAETVVTVCIGVTCNVSGVIESVTRVSEWEEF